MIIKNIDKLVRNNVLEAIKSRGDTPEFHIANNEEYFEYLKKKLIEEVNQKYGNTIVMVTHNDAIKQMADRVITLRDGMIRKNYVNETKVPAADLDW